jgi:hypothetical protein
LDVSAPFFTPFNKEDDMQQKLIRKAGLLGIILTAVGVYLAGCVDEPNPPSPPRMECSVRFVAAFQDAPAVDIWLDGEKIVSNATYKSVSAYDAKIKAGNRFVRLVPAGSADTSQAIFRRLVSFRSFMKMTAIFFDNNAEWEFLLTQERFTYADEWSKLADTSSVKLINVNSGLTPIKMVKESASGATVVGPVGVFTLSPYTNIINGTYKFFIVTATGDEMKSLDFTLEPKKRYSFIVVGSLASPEVLTLVDDPV